MAMFDSCQRNVLKALSISPFFPPPFPQILESFPFLPLEAELCPSARSPPLAGVWLQGGSHPNKPSPVLYCAQARGRGKQLRKLQRPQRFKQTVPSELGQLTAALVVGTWSCLACSLRADTQPVGLQSSAQHCCHPPGQEVTSLEQGKALPVSNPSAAMCGTG